LLRSSVLVYGSIGRLRQIHLQPAGACFVREKTESLYAFLID
jgi:hypothetical protein